MTISIKSCKACGAGEYSSIDMRNAKPGPGSYLPKKPELFYKVKKLRFGELLECLKCNSKWLLEEDRRIITLLPDSELALIYKWNEKQIIMSPELSQTLRNIGSTSSTSNHNYPCSVTTNSGEQIDFAIVCLQKETPSQWTSIRLASEIKSLSPSEFTLPLDIRKATWLTEEVSMCFAPTLVILSNGEERILNGPSNFLKINGIDSNLTTLVNNQIFNQQEYCFDEEITYFLADKLSD